MMRLRKIKWRRGTQTDAEARERLGFYNRLTMQGARAIRDGQTIRIIWETVQ